MLPPIILVNPGDSKRFHSIHPPLSLGYLASYLGKHGIETVIADEVAGDNVAGIIEKTRPKIVGITAMTPNAPSAYRVAAMARACGARTVMGGVHASIMSDEAIGNVDIVVRGEGEKALLDVARGMVVSGVIDGASISDIDEIPSPRWDLFGMDRYAASRDRYTRTHLNFVPYNTRVAAVITTRGCPYKCIFCYNSWRNYSMRFHSPLRVVTEIQELVEKYRIGAIFFFDDDFFVNKRRLEEICSLMIERKLNIIWGCQANANSITLESMRKAKEAGCRQIGFGFESGSQRILSMLKGNSASVEKNKRAVDMCREVGLLSWATFMVGNPTETIEDLQQTVDFVRNNRIDGIGVHVCTPFPGTELWNWSKEHHLVDNVKDWGRFTTGDGIFACDTLAPRTIYRYRDLIDYAQRPVTAREIFKHVVARPHLLIDAFGKPGKVFRMVKSLLVH